MRADAWIGVPLVAAALVLTMALLSTPHSQRVLGPEPARKLMHAGIGLVTLGFPWMFSSALPVLVLAVLSLIWFEAVRRVATLRRRFASVLLSVARPGRGEACFVAGTALAFLIADGSALVFCLPMAVLAFADASAALVGQHATRRRADGPIRGKTAAGSAAFFATAMLCASVALALAGWAPAALVASALLIAAVTTAVEALADHGADNLLIPVAGALLLRLLPACTGVAP
jgi:phytol kinase